MKTKKNSLLFGLGSTLLVIALFLLDSNYCYANPFCNDTFMILFLIPFPIFVFSLFTYRMKDEVFLAWFNFAKWWVPVIIGVTLWVENAGGGGGWGMNGGAFDAFFIGIFYFIFIVVSLVKIVRAYIRTK